MVLVLPWLMIITSFVVDCLFMALALYVVKELEMA